jgi:hypothetical protein
MRFTGWTDFHVHGHVVEKAPVDQAICEPSELSRLLFLDLQTLRGFGLW